MTLKGLPKSLVALILMSEADFAPSTVDAAAAQLYRAQTDSEKAKVLSKQVELLEAGISETEFLNFLKT